MEIDVAEDLKVAARRMGAQFKAKGFEIPHTLVLEGLATALGVRNFRTLRARLGFIEKLELPRWDVHYSLGVGRDATISVSATSAIQAAVRGQLELEVAANREGGSVLAQVQVVSVVDVGRALTEAPYHPSDWDVDSLGDALAAVIGLSASVLSQVDSVSEEVAIAQVFLEQFFGTAGTDYADALSAGRWVSTNAKTGTEVLLRAFGLSARVRPADAIRTLTGFLLEQAGPASGHPWVALSVEEQVQVHAAAQLPELFGALVDDVFSEEPEVSATCAVPELPSGVVTAPVTWARVLGADCIYETPTGYVAEARA